MVGGRIAVQVLSNVRPSIAVTAHEYQNTSYAYFSYPRGKLLDTHDFAATTLAASTQCSLISDQCNLNTRNASTTPFHCSDAFHGDLTASMSWGSAWLMTSFTDRTMKNNQSLNQVHNPYYVGVGALLLQQEGSGSQGLLDSPGIVQPPAGGIAFVMRCSITVYDVRYSSVGGNITLWQPTPSNVTTTNIVQAVMAETSFGHERLLQSATLAVQENNADDMLAQLAVQYSKVALSSMAGVVQPREAIIAWLRETSVVTRVPIAALYTLVVANLLYAVVGIVFCGLAIAAARGDTREVQARLSIEGIVADRFEDEKITGAATSVETLFAENISTDETTRLRVDRNAIGGYGYESTV